MASRNISTALRILSFTRQEIPALASFVFCCHCCDSQLWSLHSKVRSFLELVASSKAQQSSVLCCCQIAVFWSLCSCPSR
uniref:Uncharacterized protein n=1 Tax=Rhizophora mucronata TaxID=61149 RepID=A0A2P2JG37_RHIMU